MGCRSLCQNVKSWNNRKASRNSTYDESIIVILAMIQTKNQIHFLWNCKRIIIRSIAWKFDRITIIDSFAFEFRLIIIKHSVWTVNWDAKSRNIQFYYHYYHEYYHISMSMHLTICNYKFILIVIKIEWMLTIEIWTMYIWKLINDMMKNFVQKSGNSYILFHLHGRFEIVYIYGTMIK